MSVLSQLTDLVFQPLPSESGVSFVSYIYSHQGETHRCFRVFFKNHITNLNFQLLWNRSQRTETQPKVARNMTPLVTRTGFSFSGSS
jgi:hypothetical protein